jgi:hypothetical protein
MIEVKLSRRNLLSLLHKLEMEDSAFTIIKYTDDGMVTLIAEPDEVHYGDRIPGTMHWETERFVMEMNKALEIVREARSTER